MQENTSDNQVEYEFVLIDELVPEDLLLRKIRKTIDFSFINDKTKSLYSANNGRPAVPPETFFKILLIGDLYSIRSERQIIRKIQG